jgi:hypothetical protein
MTTTLKLSGNMVTVPMAKKMHQFSICYRSAERVTTDALELVYPVGCWSEIIEARGWDDAKTVCESRGEYVDVRYIMAVGDLEYIH